LCLYRVQVVAIYLRVGEGCGAVIGHPIYNAMITLAILLAALLVGVQTEMATPGSGSHQDPAVAGLNAFVLAIYTLDVALKLVAEGLKPWCYFADAWNRFDFAIVAACFVFMAPALAASQSIIAMLRILRLLRVLKLVRILPQLRIIVEALINSVGSIFFVTIILFIVFYVYANVGMVLFAQNDAEHFGNLQFALMTMVRIATQDNWTDILYVVQPLPLPHPPPYVGRCVLKLKKKDK
jgi:voltage-gated sodium channel